MPRGARARRRARGRLRGARDPPAPGGDAEAARLDELRALLAHPKAVAVGETGLDYFRDYAPHDAQRRAVRGAARARRASSASPSSSTPARPTTRRPAALAGFDGTVVLHCFSSPGLLAPALERGWYVSFAGNVTYPKAAELREAAARVPADRLLAETDSPYLAPQPVRGKPNEPANVVHTLAVARRGARRRRRPSSRRRSTRTRPRPSACRERVVPKKALGQHFLVDENILGVIGRLAELEPDDVVLEIGPGLGVLTALPRRPRRARPRGRARPLARAVACATSPAPERRARTGATRSRSTSPRSTRRREARREPAVQRRHAARRREPRRPAGASSCGA